MGVKVLPWCRLLQQVQNDLLPGLHLVEFFLHDGQLGLERLNLLAHFFLSAAWFEGAQADRDASAMSMTMKRQKPEETGGCVKPVTVGIKVTSEEIGLRPDPSPGRLTRDRRVPCWLQPSLRDKFCVGNG